MFIDKFKEVLSHPADEAVAIVTQGPEEPHVSNTWNSYVAIASNNRLLMPMGRMSQTEQNLAFNNQVKLTVASREVQGLNYKGTGFLVVGTGQVITEKN